MRHAPLTLTGAPVAKGKFACGVAKRVIVNASIN
jgi:hypothetical protein